MGSCVNGALMRMDIRQLHVSVNAPPPTSASIYIIRLFPLLQMIPPPSLTRMIQLPPTTIQLRNLFWTLSNCQHRCGPFSPYCFCYLFHQTHIKNSSMHVPSQNMNEISLSCLPHHPARATSSLKFSVRIFRKPMMRILFGI